MQGEDGRGEADDAGGGAARLAQEPPSPEGGHGLLDERGSSRASGCESLPAGGEGPQRPW